MSLIPEGSILRAHFTGLVFLECHLRATTRLKWSHKMSYKRVSFLVHMASEFMSVILLTITLFFFV